MNEIDFVTAFARLLRDGSLRDRFAKDPAQTTEQLGVSAEARLALMALAADELEFQAEVLLRKRYDMVSRMLPQTLANAREDAWPTFAAYARKVWPTGEPAELEDAKGFAAHLQARSPSIVCSAERNRIEFASGQARWKACLVCDVPIRARNRDAVQFFVRTTGHSWREILLHFGP